MYYFFAVNVCGSVFRYNKAELDFHLFGFLVISLVLSLVLREYG